MKHIVAMGGGGFSMEPDNPLLDAYVLSLSSTKRPKVCFVGTASGDAESYIQRFYAAFRELDCAPSHLSLFAGHTADIESFLLDQDVIYVGGGNTRNLITLWKDWGVDQIIRKAWEKEIVLAGISAGSLCWFEEGVTDSIPGTLSPIKCLGLLSGSNCPHYDGEKDRRPSYHRLVEERKLGPGLAAEDSVGLHFQGRELHRVVTSVEGKKAYRLKLENGKCVEEALVATHISSFV